MRVAVCALIMSSVLVFTTVCIFAMSNTAIRKNELQHSLSAAMDSSLEILCSEKSYSFSEDESTATDEFIADFLEKLLVNTSSDSEIKVSVLAVDVQKGLLDVEVTETYKHTTGAESSVSCRKTAIYEEAPIKDTADSPDASDNSLNSKSYYTVRYFDGDRILRVQNVHGGTNLPFPDFSPKKTGKWLCDGKAVLAQGISLPVRHDLDLIWSE